MTTKPHPVFDDVELEFCPVCQEWKYNVCVDPDKCGHEPEKTVIPPAANTPYAGAHPPWYYLTVGGAGLFTAHQTDQGASLPSPRPLVSPIRSLWPSSNIGLRTLTPSGRRCRFKPCWPRHLFFNPETRHD